MGLLLLASVALAPMAGCQTSSIDDFAPLEGVRNTGTTPDLNVPRPAETAQLSAAETDQKVAELKAAQQNAAAGRGGAPATNTEQFRRAQANQQKTLEEIEAQ